MIKGSFIGSRTSIGNGVHVINSSVEYSVVLKNALIRVWKG